MPKSILVFVAISLALEVCLIEAVSSAPNLVQSQRKSDSSVALSKISPQSRYVMANGIRIHYLEWGTGKDAIVLVHGLYDSAEVWSSVAALLARGYRIIAPDRRGAGLTDKPEDGYDYGTLAHDVEALIVNLNLGRVHLVGHSAGAGVAVTVAATAPEKIRTLVLVDGGFWPKRSDSTGTLPAAQCDATPIECRRKAALESGGKAYDAESLYPRIRMPVLLLMAVPAMVPTREFAAGLADAKQHVSTVARRKLSNGQMILIKDTGHWIQTDQPKAVARWIETITRRHSTNTRRRSSAR